MSWYARGRCGSVESMTDSKNSTFDATNIAVLGGGQIGEALIAGVLAGGRDPQTLTVTNRSVEKQSYFADTYGVPTTADNTAAVKGAGVVFACVKPYAIEGLLREVGEHLEPNAVVVSMAAGLTLEALEGALPADTAVVRVMPNTPMLVGAGMNACVPGTAASEDDMEGVAELLGAVGDVVVVAEKDMDAVTALSGSSPAYFFLVTEALTDAGVNLGLTRDVAQQLATSAAAGAGAMLKDSGKDPVTLRANVSSPGGTTVAALRELEESGIRGAFFRAAQACADRSKELGD